MFSTSELKLLAVEVAQISRETGSWMLAQQVDETTAESKSHNNLVTFVDKESERRIAERLGHLLPAAGILAEEGTERPSADEVKWVIDPLDGTTNYVHGVPVWCISIALVHGREPLLGVIYDPVRLECFSAVKGGGAMLNQQPIRVSVIDTLKQSLLATGFPYHDFGRQEAYLQLFAQLMQSTRGMRRLGSAALDMAWVANGRFDGFYEYGLQPWDVAAGTIVVREAGGLCSGFSAESDPVFGQSLCCTNGLIHEELQRIISAYF